PVEAAHVDVAAVAEADAGDALQRIGRGTVALTLQVFLRHACPHRGTQQHRLRDVFALDLDRVQFGGLHRRSGRGRRAGGDGGGLRGRRGGGGGLRRRDAGREQGRDRQEQARTGGGELHEWQPFNGVRCV